MRVPVTVLAAFSAMLAPAPRVTATDLPPGDPIAGRTLARAICAGCHDVEREWTERAAFYGPAFADIAVMPGLTAMRLRVYLRTPHVEMPDLILTEQEVDDVISYILGLKPREP